ncbi:YggS family pyridoxal phosphate-dependent enzyme [Hyphococcus sp. DH-69]|uniref:YggS family pyridoxal phosphate-dependent enzyme n=1 Tax=Hyphococcus formosus TaxID=3143534 RepID=UPI00398AECD8
MTIDDQNNLPDDINPAENLAAITEDISAALREAGKEQNHVTIVAVSKQHEAARILPVLETGHRVFGENRVQEAQAKWSALIEKYPDTELRLIGPLQTNKVKEAVALFDVIESVDRIKLAKALAKEFEKQDKRLKLFVQVNTGEEEQKSGIAPNDVVTFVDECRDQLGLTIEGLMCIPPAADDPAPHFALLAKLAKDCGVSALSMGMSGDYSIAAQLGATHVRVGSAIFGLRPAK